MTAQDWFLAGSLLLNVVLLVVVFFKTALNEMLVSGFKARADRRRSTRDLMVQLYGRLQQFDANYLLLLMANAQENQKLMDTAGAPNIETLKFIARYELDFPPRIRRSLRAVRAVMEVDDVRELRDRRAILARSGRVMEQIESLRKELERLVK